MIKKKCFVRGFFGLLIVMCMVTRLYANGVNIDCPVSRTIIPLTYNVEGHTTSAASFMYGEYRGESVTGNQLLTKLQAIPESERWGYPEYVIIKRFEYSKAGDGEKLYGLWEEGYSRTKVMRGDKIPTEKVARIQELQSRYSDITFLAKSYFGPYVRIDYQLEQSGPNDKKAVMSVRLKRVGNRFWLTMENTGLSLFNVVLDSYRSRKQKVPQPQVPATEINNMEWIAFDVDLQALPKHRNHKMLRRFSEVSQWTEIDLPLNFTTNYLLIYHKLKPENLQLKYGIESQGLSPEMAFFDSAIGIYQSKKESDILNLWSTTSQVTVQKQFSLSITSPFGLHPKIVATLPSTSGSIFFYKLDEAAPMVMCLVKNGLGNYKLSRNLEDPQAISEPFFNWDLLVVIMEQYKN